MGLRSSLALLAVAALSVPALHAQLNEVPTIDGYITQLTSQRSFQVDGRTVLATEKTSRVCPNVGYETAASTLTLSLGDHVHVFGSWKKNEGAVHADTICDLAMPEEKISGVGRVEGREGRYLLADGRLLAYDRKTQVSNGSRSLDDARPNDWMEYTARTRAGEPPLLLSVSITRPSITRMEDRLRTSEIKELDAPNVDGKVDGRVRFVDSGLRIGRSAPHKLPAGSALERVQRIGGRLIPPYQRTLDPGDAAAIPFHFYVIADRKSPACVPLASGEIFVLSSVVDRLTDDNGLASLMASCMAMLLEKQGVRLTSEQRKRGEVEIVAYVGGGLPGLAAVELVGSVYDAKYQHKLQAQFARVSLDLLDEAGYPIQEAPHAMELVEAKNAPLKPTAQPSPGVEPFYQALAERERARGRQGSAALTTPAP